MLADFCPQGNAQGTHIHNPFIFSILKQINKKIRINIQIRGKPFGNLK